MRKTITLGLASIVLAATACSTAHRAETAVVDTGRGIGKGASSGGNAVACGARSVGGESAAQQRNCARAGSQAQGAGSSFESAGHAITAPNPPAPTSTGGGPKNK
jgi:hypothetical protein